MNLWLLIILTAFIAILLKALLFSKPKSNQNSKLPPGPRTVPIISTILWLRKSTIELESSLRKIRSKFGPIVTIRMASRPFIFVCSQELAHEALVQNGAIFADRPNALPTTKILTSNQHNITSGGYGPTWRILRRNLTSQILHPARAKDFSHGRRWVLHTLLRNLSADSACDGATVKVANHFHHAMFCLLVYMCFGQKLEESEISDIEALQHRYLTSLSRFQILNVWPFATKILLRSRWNELFDLRRRQEQVLIPHIRARKHQATEDVSSYVDSLMTLELSENDNTKRKLTEQEMVTACSEFFNAGTDTTATSLQWIMANIVKYPNIQTAIFEEIKVLIEEKAEVEEDDLPKLPYLKAVVLEGLRRHPPAHFLLPHAVTQETELGGYTVPRNAIVNFTVAEMGRDPDVWEDPMEFRPERFLMGQEELDVTGNREIKMMPFGAGRRICPGIYLAMLHLEYYVANLVWKFEWKVGDGYDVDLAEKEEFTTVMKHPLQVCITPR
ncbi:cytochrome P450 89A2-like [Silene latifolia]|uniref:cytochrome P450 89A2-like n=1 Tax=Silene latifolia TaxID=37657 RepID=UPI003D7743F1